MVSLQIETISREGSNLSLSITGRLDMNTCESAQQQIQQLLGDAICLSLDFSKLDYISSMGLRVLLTIAKQLRAKNGSLVILNALVPVQEVFRITGLEKMIPLT